MRKAKPLRSEMGWSSRDRITVRGFDLTKDLLGKIDLGAMAWLEITGRLPDAREAEVFNALLVTLVEHGMTPQAISARLISTCAPEAMQAAVAAGLLGVGSVFAGGSEEIARVLQAALADTAAGADRHRREERLSRALRGAARGNRRRRRSAPRPQPADQRHRRDRRHPVGA